MKCSFLAVMILSGCIAAFATGPAADAPSRAIADKTLVAWISPANLQQQGSGVVSMMNGTS